MSDVFNYVLAALAAMYLTYVMVNTDGLLGMFKWLRSIDRIHVTACAWCLVFWVSAAMFLLLRTDLAPIVHVLAVAGGAMFAWKYGGLK